MGHGSVSQQHDLVFDEAKSMPQVMKEVKV